MIYSVKQVVDALKVVYIIALDLNCWGLTRDILALSECEGGMELAMPHNFLRWPH